MEHIDHEQERIRSVEPSVAKSIHELSMIELMAEIAHKTRLLVEKEIDLARVEIKRDLDAELGMVKGMAASALAAIMALNMFLVAAVLALIPYAQGWLVAVSFAATLLIAAVILGLVAWQRRVKHPLKVTRRTLNEDVQWAKEELT